MEEIRDGDRDVVWRFDETFLTSTWTCLWGRGCLGILPEPAPQLGQGCCSLGAVLDGHDEARNLAALAATVATERFQHHAEAASGGVLVDTDEGPATRVVDGACIFLNRPGFPGGAGCALHLEALASGESPVEWKPNVCWQLPIHVDWDDAGTVAEVRGWSRADWGAEGATMHWCCTEDRRPDEGADAYSGTRPVVDELGEELTAIVGTEVYVELRRRLTGAD
ncbi:MAG TPA: hypothetical protein VM933_08350 [Acidimicrobiales bacterium]|nr:hypothetical protein [Acidimicrobiales bacterium]